MSIYIHIYIYMYVFMCVLERERERERERESFGVSSPAKDIWTTRIREERKDAFFSVPSEVGLRCLPL